MTTLKEYFSRQTPLDFPLPKKRKPYITVRTLHWGDYTVQASHKASGSGKIELFALGEQVNVLYIQGIDWQELNREAEALRAILETEKPQAQLDKPRGSVLSWS